MGPAIIVFPDCFTALGGNQCVNRHDWPNTLNELAKQLPG